MFAFGRISWEKGFDRLIAALPLVPAARVIIAGGDGGQADALAEQARKLNVADRVTIIARHVEGADKEALFASAASFAMTSLSENFGLAAFEAMRRGLPVLATPDVGMSEIVRKAEAGVIVDPSPDGIARGLRDAASRRSRCESRHGRWRGRGAGDRRVWMECRGRAHDRRSIAWPSGGRVGAHAMMELLEQSPFDPVSERRIVIIADWLPPDFGAVGQYMQMRAEHLAERGHEVTLVGLATAKSSIVRRVIGKSTLAELRLQARPVPRGSLVTRLLWTIRTNLRLVVAAFAAMRAADGILFTGSPPFLIHLLVPLKFLWRGRLVYRITDFHPECLIAAQDEPSRLLTTLLALTNFWRRRVDRFEVLGEDQMRRVRDEAGIAGDRISLVRDGSPVAFRDDGDVVEPVPAELAGALRAALLGELRYRPRGSRPSWRATGCTIARAAAEVRLWLSATGGGAEEVAGRLTALGLPFHRSRPVPLERLAGLLKAPDAHLVVLKDSFVGFVMPSKIYACLGSAKPLIFVGSADSDVDLLSRKSQVPYWRVACGDPQGLAAAFEALADRGRNR